MQAQAHPLEPFFFRMVHNSYEGVLGLRDPDMTAYVARVLCEFSLTDKLYKVRDAMGRPVRKLAEMVKAADPVFGAAPSFDAERALRKHIGDYALFVAGMYPEALGTGRERRHQPSLGELVRTGKESYFIVSQFNLCEYQQEAPLFARLSGEFERCILGLKLVREEIKPKPRMLTSPREPGTDRRDNGATRQ